MAGQQGWKLTGFPFLVIIWHFKSHHVRFGERLRLKATREVVLSAGTVATPQILLLSGIGDTEHLKQVEAVLPA